MPLVNFKKLEAYVLNKKNYNEMNFSQDMI